MTLYRIRETDRIYKQLLSSKPDVPFIVPVSSFLKEIRL